MPASYCPTCLRVFTPRFERTGYTITVKGRAVLKEWQQLNGK